MSYPSMELHGDPIAPVIPGATTILAFAAICRTLGAIDDSIFAAIAAMVFVTTMAAPPLLKFATHRQTRRQSGTC